MRPELARQRAASSSVECAAVLLQGELLTKQRTCVQVGARLYLRCFR